MLNFAKNCRPHAGVQSAFFGKDKTMMLNIRRSFACAFGAIYSHFFTQRTQRRRGRKDA